MSSSPGRKLISTMIDRSTWAAIQKTPPSRLTIQLMEKDLQQHSCQARQQAFLLPPLDQ
jgi:hypothetical protein